MSAPRFRYTPCVLSGPFAFVSAWWRSILPPVLGSAGGVGEQTQRIFDNLHLVLLDYGVTLEELCMARIYTTCFDLFEEINAAYGRPSSRPS
jgi:2-iminobutanoate/2-iminopropanoate deaminase